MARLRYAVRANHTFVINGETVFGVAFTKSDQTMRYVDRDVLWSLEPGEYISVDDVLARGILESLTDVDGQPLFAVEADGPVRRDLETEVFEPRRVAARTR